jgi:DNA-binding PadR family transcriptional regulator
MSVPHALLGLLDRQPNHGYDLKRAYDERFSFRRPLQFGQVYATLGRLERDRLVRVTGVGAAGGPERTTYAITGAGRDQFGSWLAAPEPPSPYLQPDLYTKVVLALLSDRPAQPVLDRQRDAHRQAMRELTAAKREAPLPEALAADLAIFHLEADLRWIDATAARLAALRKELGT